MLSATRTPIEPGDPVWVTTPGQEQAAQAVLVRKEPGRNTATVQLLSDAAGAHSLVELGRVSYRRAGDKPPVAQPAPPTPTPAATPSADAFDQLVALFPRVIERLQADVQAAREQRDSKAKELKAEGQSYRELKKLRAFQTRRLQTALKVLTRPIVKTGRRGSNSAWWTPERRKAAGERMSKMNADKAAKRGKGKAGE